jgi:hypothetical protein
MSYRLVRPTVYLVGTGMTLQKKTVMAATEAVCVVNQRQRQREQLVKQI